MKEIFSKWLQAKQLTLEDIITILLEYDSLYNDGSLTPEKVVFLLNSVSLPVKTMINSAMFKIAYKNGWDITSVYDKNGKLIMRFTNIN